MDRRAYEKELLQTVARMAMPRIADETRTLERRFRARLDRAVDEMRSAIAGVNDESVLMTIDAQAFEDFVADEILSLAAWEEKLSYAAKGW